MDAWETDLKREVNRSLKEKGQLEVTAAAWQKLRDEEGDGFEYMEAEDLVMTIVDRREWPEFSVQKRRPRTEVIRERWALAPDHWLALWPAEMSRYEPWQRRALHALGRIPLLQAYDTFSDVPGYRPLIDTDFIPEKELGATVATFSRWFTRGEMKVLEWVVPRSPEHPNGVDGILMYRYGTWRKRSPEIPDPGPEESDEPTWLREALLMCETEATEVDGSPGWKRHENPLFAVHMLARQIVDETLLPISQVVSFLLCNRMPSPPWMRAVVRSAPGSFQNGQPKMFITLEVRDPLLITDQQVGAFYAEVRQSLFGKRACFRPWRQRMVDFVDERRRDARVEGTKVPTWEKLRAAWNRVYPDKKYSSWRSMLNSYKLSR